ncbi:hypothetical protein G6F51_014213 [Rhizopus arrhizus]|uniref:Uncharacterized protein n=1 Tax=Rhizopus oryzae TaxID=64495 RepID=A0A9P6XNJ9_RHIOR|nr:hypothetical protein G6F51_014213 [Rhizopus arrhizus]
MPVSDTSKKGRRLKNSRAGIIRIPTEATWDAPEPYIGVARKLRDETLYADIFYQYDKSAAGARTDGIITGIAQKLKEKLPNIKVVGVDPVGSILVLPS